MIQLPVDSNSKILREKTLINKRVCWDYILKPLSVINNYKNLNEKLFEVDTSLLIINKQWQRRDWITNEPITIYSSTQTGKLFCIGKYFLSPEYTCIVWLLEQKDIVYGVGPAYWLFCYDKNGILKDYVCIGLKQEFSLFMVNSTTNIKFSISENHEIRKTGEQKIYVENYIDIPTAFIGKEDSIIIASLYDKIPKPVNKDYPPFIYKEENKLVYFTEERKKINSSIILNIDKEKFEVFDIK